MPDGGCNVILMTFRFDFPFLPLLMKGSAFRLIRKMRRATSPLQIEVMKNNDTVNNATATATATVEFPPALMADGIALAKAIMKSQLKFALLWADAILQDCDGLELIKACYVAAGFTARDARGTTTNSSKFVAPALMVRNGAMSEKAFFALKTSEASAAFKEAGGMKGEGLSPAAWQSAREEIASREAVEKVGGEARPPSGEEKDKPSLSAYQILSAAIALRKGELNQNERALLVEQLLA